MPTRPNGPPAPRSVRLPTPPVRRTLAAERYATGDRLSADRCATAHVRVHKLTQAGAGSVFAVTGTLTTTTGSAVQLGGRLRDLELFAEALRAALAEARRAGGR